MHQFRQLLVASFRKELFRTSETNPSFTAVTVREGEIFVNSRRQCTASNVSSRRLSFIKCITFTAYEQQHNTMATIPTNRDKNVVDGLQDHQQIEDGKARAKVAFAGGGESPTESSSGEGRLLPSALDYDGNSSNESAVSSLTNSSWRLKGFEDSSGEDSTSGEEQKKKRKEASSKKARSKNGAKRSSSLPKKRKVEGKAASSKAVTDVSSTSGSNEERNPKKMKSETSSSESDWNSQPQSGKKGNDPACDAVKSDGKKSDSSSKESNGRGSHAGSVNTQKMKAAKEALAAKREYNRQVASRARARHKDKIATLQEQTARLKKDTEDLKQKNEILQGQVDILTEQNRDLVAIRQQMQSQNVAMTAMPVGQPISAPVQAPQQISQPLYVGSMNQSFVDGNSRSSAPPIQQPGATNGMAQTAAPLQPSMPYSGSQSQQGELANQLTQLLVNMVNAAAAPQVQPQMQPQDFSRANFIPLSSNGSGSDSGSDDLSRGIQR